MAINDIGWRARSSSRTARGSAASGSPRGGSSILAHCGAGALRLPPRGRDPRRRRGHPPHLPPPGRLRAPTAKPDEVPDPHHGLGELEAEVERDLAEVRAEGGARLPFDPEKSPIRGSADRCASRAPGAGRSGGTGGLRPPQGPGPAPADPAGPAGVRRGRAPLVVDERAAAVAGGLLDRDGDRSPGRPHRCPDAPAGRAGPGVRRRDGAHLGQPGPALPLGEDDRRAVALRAAGRGGPRSRGRPHDCQPDELPGAEACKLAVTQSRGLGKVLSDHLAARPGPGGRGRRPRHQDQRLPERVWTAPRRGPGVPGLVRRSPARPRLSTS